MEVHKEISLERENSYQEHISQLFFSQFQSHQAQGGSLLQSGRYVKRLTKSSLTWGKSEYRLVWYSLEGSQASQTFLIPLSISHSLLTHS